MKAAAQPDAIWSWFRFANEDPKLQFRRAATPAQALRAAVRASGANRETTRLAQAMVSGKLIAHPSDCVRSDALVLATAALARRHHVQVLCRSAEAAARRMAEGQSLFVRLGLRVSVVTGDAEQRPAAYGAQIVFAAADRLAQDHLRAQVQALRRNTPLRPSVANLARTNHTSGHDLPLNPVALIDDADLILMALSQPINLTSEAEKAIGRRLADEAFEALATLVLGVDYKSDPVTNRIMLTEQGERRLATYAALFRGPWADLEWRRETIFSALTIRDRYLNGRDYTLEDGVISLAKPIGDKAPNPSIPDLIAAKERQGYSNRQLHTIDLRRLLPRFGHLGGVGLNLQKYRAELKDAIGLKIVGKTGMGPHVHIGFNLYSDRAAWADAVIAAAAQDALVWAATDADAKALQAAGLQQSIVAGPMILDVEKRSHLIQAGGAPSAITARLSQKWPNIAWQTHVSPEDGFLAILPPDHQELTALAKGLNQMSYGRALAAAEIEADTQRRRRTQSEAYFDRILEFLEPMP